MSAQITGCENSKSEKLIGMRFHNNYDFSLLPVNSSRIDTKNINYLIPIRHRSFSICVFTHPEYKAELFQKTKIDRF
jgi:hypothetical protein